MKPIRIPTNQARPFRRDGGFTIIELMVVVSIVSILSVLAIAVYQDYVTRSKVSEGMMFVAEAKTSVSEYYSNTRRRPSNNQQAGLASPEEYDKMEYIERLEVGTIGDAPAGTITVTFDIPQLGTDNMLQLIPSTALGVMTWECTAPDENGVIDSRLPPNCRSSG